MQFVRVKELVDIFINYFVQSAQTLKKIQSGIRKGVRP